MVIFECVILLISGFPSATVRFSELWQTAMLRLEQTCGCFVSPYGWIWEFLNWHVIKEVHLPGELLSTSNGTANWFECATSRRPGLWKADITALGLQPFPGFRGMSVLAIEKTTAFLHLSTVLLFLHNKIWNMTLAGLISESCFMCPAGKLVLVTLPPVKLCRDKTLSRSW